MNSESESSLDEQEREEVRDPSTSLLRNTNMEAQAEHEKIKRFKTIYFNTTCLGITLVVLTFFWLNHYLGGFSIAQPSTEFNWHPLLMVLGMVFLYSQSILVYRTGRNSPKFRLKVIHAGLHIAIVVMAGFALKAAFDSHNYHVPPLKNLYTLHSWIGILTVGLIVFQLAIGFTTFLYPGGSKVIRTAVLPYHVSLGTAGFIMALVATVTGFAEKAVFSLGNDYQNRSISGIILNIMGLVTVVFGILTLHLLSETDYKRIEHVEDQVALSE